MGGKGFSGKSEQEQKGGAWCARGGGAGLPLQQCASFCARQPQAAPLRLQLRVSAGPALLTHYASALPQAPLPSLPRPAPGATQAQAVAVGQGGIVAKSKVPTAGPAASNGTVRLCVEDPITGRDVANGSHCIEDVGLPGVAGVAWGGVARGQGVVARA